MGRAQSASELRSGPSLTNLVHGPSLRRFRDANPEEIEALTLEGMRTAVMSQLHAGNLEVSVVGDLEPEQLEVCRRNPQGTVLMWPSTPMHASAAVSIHAPKSFAPHAQDLALRYLGTIAPREDTGAKQQQDAIEVQSPPAELRRQTWHLRARV